LALKYYIVKLDVIVIDRFGGVCIVVSVQTMGVWWHSAVSCRRCKMLYILAASLHYAFCNRISFVFYYI